MTCETVDKLQRQPGPLANANMKHTLRAFSNSELGECKQKSQHP
jgi:hypothetical protein